MSSPEHLRKRLEALNREPLPEREKQAADVDGVRRKLSKQRRRRSASAEPPAEATHAERPPQPILYRRDLQQKEPAPRRLRVSGEPLDLAGAVGGSEVRCPRGDRAFLIANDVRELGEHTAELCGAFQKVLLHESSNARRWIATMCEGQGAAPSDVIFVDLETTGLGSTPLFLIGTMTWENDGLVVRQYFARTYAEEGATIALFLARLADKPLVVSFNGKSFDLPYVRVRAAANAIPYAAPSAHFDLLHVSRRIWKGRLPNCRLQTLERHICGRTRHGDIPGEEIPQAYHDYVRTGDAREMVQCLEHNMLDLVTLADLMVRLPPPG